MKILIEEYNPEWPSLFQRIKSELEVILNEFNPRIEHIGSTSVPGLAAKPIIDISAGLESTAYLDKTVEPMIKYHYLYYEIFNSSCPERRFFVGLKDPINSHSFQNTYSRNDVIPHDEINLLTISHVHIWVYGTDRIRHIAFRDYLKSHPEVKREYSELKKHLSLKSWKDGMEYNNAKDGFIKVVQDKAIVWYNEKNNIRR